MNSSYMGPPNGGRQMQDMAGGNPADMQKVRRNMAMAQQLGPAPATAGTPFASMQGALSQYGKSPVNSGNQFDALSHYFPQSGGGAPSFSLQGGMMQKPGAMMAPPSLGPTMAPPPSMGPPGMGFGPSPGMGQMPMKPAFAGGAAPPPGPATDVYMQGPRPGLYR